MVETEGSELIRHDALQNKVIKLHVLIGLRRVDKPRLVLRLISQRDLPLGNLIHGQKRSLTLTVASAKFAMQPAAALETVEARLRTTVA